MTTLSLSHLETRAKSAYVGAMRLMRTVCERTGIASWLEARQDRSVWAHWLRSLLAIHDIDALVRLDVPWWTYDAIAEVDRFLADRPGARVFEYGSGASTLWLAKRAASVTSVEHDGHWHALVRGRLADAGLDRDVDHRHVPADATRDPAYASGKPDHETLGFRSYARTIAGEPEPFDLIVVDGRARAACLMEAVPRLKPDGLIVFDNSHRKRYQDAIGAAGLRLRRYRGLAPSLPYRDETTLLSPLATSPATPRPEGR